MSELTPKQFFNLKVDTTKDGLWESLGITNQDSDHIADISDDAVEKFLECISEQLEYIINNATKEELLIMLASAHIQMLEQEYGAVPLKTDELEHPNN